MGAIYVHKQAAVAGGVNLLVNPLIAWAGRPDGFMTVGDMAGTLIGTSIIMSVIVALFGAAGVRRERSAGRDVAVEARPLEERLLSRLPAGPWRLGALLGVAAVIVVAAVLWTLSGLGFEGMSFLAYAFVLGVYAGGLAYLVMRWTILRQVLQTRVHPLVAS